MMSSMVFSAPLMRSSSLRKWPSASSQGMVLIQAMLAPINEYGFAAAAHKRQFA
jgi:hypothetical protein